MEILRVNLIGPFLAVKHGAPPMIARGRGSIVLTASVAALRANAGGAPYGASKAGVVASRRAPPMRPLARACASTRYAPA